MVTNMNLDGILPFHLNNIVLVSSSSSSSSSGDRVARLTRISLLLMHLFLYTNLQMESVKAGLCWSSANRDGRCTDLLRTDVTKEECCNSGDNYGMTTTAFSPEDLKSGQLFFYRALRGGVPCTPCKVTCEGVRCGPGRRCVVKQGHKPSCICSPKCSRRKRRMGPVCGSDGRTYRHVCRLLKRKCRKDGTLSVSYYGPCQDNCKNIKCSGSKTCLLDQNLKPHCVRCRQSCPPVKLGSGSGPVCGVDNITYPSYCHLQRASCLSGRSIQAAYRGDCKSNATCSNIKCSNKDHKCLVDIIDNGQPRCVTCPVPCPDKLSKAFDTSNLLCASNNVTYMNWCSMMQDACASGIYLHAVTSGPCNSAPNQTIHETNVIPVTLFH